MNRALFMTIGTGTGDSDEKVQNLAHGLLQSIKQHRPDKLVFFGSKLSKNTLESMEKLSYSVMGQPIPPYEFLLIENVDEFNDCFTPIKDKIQEYSDYEVLIDYTSGTKTMTMSAAICSVLYHKELVMVSGSRNSNGLVKSRTEIPKPQNIYKVYDEILFKEFKTYFNTFRFQSALETLDKIVELDNKEGYELLAMGYQAWDLFDHSRSKELLDSDPVRSLEHIKTSLNKNRSVLGVLGNPKQKNKCAYLIADLINNAKRRASENKFDDAVARLYRCVELIAQCTLKGLGIDTSDVNESKLSDLTIRKMNLKKIDGKIKLGLRDSYNVLRYEKHDLGISFDQDKQLKNLLKSRNESILAHGLKPVKKEVCEDLLEKTIELALQVYPKLDTLMIKAEFPKI